MATGMVFWSLAFNQLNGSHPLVVLHKIELFDVLNGENSFACRWNYDKTEVSIVFYETEFTR